MNAKPVLARPHVFTTVVAALASVVISIGLLFAATGAFLRDGAPLEHVVVAEHACADHAYVSERDACIRTYLAAASPQRVASR